MSPSYVTGGIDCGKAQLDASVYPDGAHLRVANTSAGHRELIGWFVERGVRRVGLEASGGCERAVRDALCHAGLEAVLHDPARVRHFARAKGRRAKSDAIDAALIAAFTAAFPEIAPVMVDSRREGLVALLRVRSQLVSKASDLAKAASGLPAEAGEIVRGALEAMGEAVRRLEARIRRQVEAEPALARRVAALDSAPGLGWLSAVSLAVLLPELGRIDGGRIAALLGVAPYDDDSGQRHGRRHIAGGRAEARQVLYMAVLGPATQGRGVLAGFYARLVGRGKPPKLALTACMRKMIVRLNAMLANGQTWVEDRPT